MKLKDICEINPRMQKIDDSTEVSFVSMPSVSEDGKIDTTDIRRYSDVKKGYTSFKENDVLFAKITPCMENGKGAIARGLRNGYGCGSSEFHVLRSNDKAMPEWIYCLTSWQRFRKKAEKHMTGSAGQRRVPKQYLENYEIRLPELKVQAQQVETLMHLRSIIDRRITEVRSLDELIKARFVELFGNPIKNEKGLPTILGETLFKLSNGKFLPDSKRFSEGIPAYGGNGISWYTDEILCDVDTIIVGRVGFQSGNVHLAKAPLWVTDNAMYISSINSHDCDIRFLCALMEHIDFTRYQDAGDLKKITQKPFMQMHYLMPSLSLQMQYITFVEQVNKSKAAVQKSLDETQMLFDSLMQKYFG